MNDTHREQHRKLILAINQQLPFYGYRKIALEVHARNGELSEKQVCRLMHIMHIKALHTKKLTGIKHPETRYILTCLNIRSYGILTRCESLTWPKSSFQDSGMCASTEAKNKSATQWSENQRVLHL